jgi:DNA-binding CsgD family transcriptional regulator
MSNHQVEDFIHTTQHCVSDEILDHIYMNTLMQLGFDQFTHSYYRKNDFTAHQHDLFTPQLLPWHQHFLNESYEEIDDIGEKARANIFPIIWDLHQEYKGAKGKKKKMITEALDFNLSTGISIPIHDLNNETSLLVIHDQNIKHQFNNKPYLPMIFQQLAFYYHNRLSHFIHIKKNTVNSCLTPREIECLNLTAQFKTAKEIARQLNISSRTVGFHIENANKKLGAKNKFEAISKLIVD